MGREPLTPASSRIDPLRQLESLRKVSAEEPIEASHDKVAAF